MGEYKRRGCSSPFCFPFSLSNNTAFPPFQCSSVKRPSPHPTLFTFNQASINVKTLDLDSERYQIGSEPIRAFSMMSIAAVFYSLLFPLNQTQNIPRLR
jgi:hypothetical protein